MKTIRLLTCLFVIISLLSCNRQDSSKNNQSKIFNELVQAYTKSSISVADEIQIRLKKEVPQARQGDVIDKSVYSISPAVDATAFWIDSKTIGVKPDKWLESDKKYTISINAGKLFDEYKNNDPLNFIYKTRKQDFSVKVGSLIAQEKRYRIEGVVELADVAKNDDVEKLISFKNNEYNSLIKWDHFQKDRHKFYIDSIKRLEDAYQLVIQHDGSALNVDKKDELLVEIPGFNNFKFIRNSVVSPSLAGLSGAQVITIEFSDPIDPKQDLNGLVSIDGVKNLNLEKDNNRIKVFPENRLYGVQNLNISADIRNMSGYALKESISLKVNFEALKPEVSFLQSGVIMPSSDNSCMVPFKAVNLSAVDVYIIKVYEKNIPYFLQSNRLDGNDDLVHYGRLLLKKKIELKDAAIDPGSWHNYSLDLKELIQTEPGAIYRIEFRYKKAYSTYPCKESETEDNLVDEDEEQSVDEIWDESMYYWPRYEYSDNYNWSQRNNPCDESYYQNKWVYRNVLVSNLGLIVKTNGEGIYRAYATNILTAEPLDGAEVEFYSHQNLLIDNARTNSDGMAELQTDKLPWLAIVKKGEQKTYLRVDDGTSLSYSSFDVGGSKPSKGLGAFIYGERGVWRPGDTIHLACVINDKENPLPENQPATIYFYNPQGKLVQKIVNDHPVNKFYKFELLTDKEAPTGNWLGKVRIGGAEFTKTIKIETIKPNKLKINLDFGSDILDGSKPVNGILNVAWLHGAKGKNLKVRTDVMFRSKSLNFDHLPGFVFSDPAKTLDAREETILDGKTDAVGSTSITFQKSLERYAPSVVNAIFTTKAFEPGGEFSISQQVKTFSPYDRYIGIRMPEKPRNSWHYNSGTDYNVEVASVDINGEPIDVDRLRVEVYKLEWEWWWHSGREDLAYYIQRSYNKPVLTKTIYTKDGKGLFSFNIDKNSWGRYLVRVVDSKGHSTGKIVYFDWPWRKSNEGMGGATRLAFSTDKESYTVGDEILVDVPAEKGSKALISVESGTKIIQSFWLNIDEQAGKFKLKAVPEMAPNAYITITLLQPHAKTVNENPIRLYGVIPLFVNNPETVLEPLISAPDKIEPEQEFEVKVNESKGRPMTYTIAIVDEGLLDITNYNTPDIHKAFNVRKALLVKMWDMFDYVSGAFGGKIEKVIGIGGGDELSDKDKKDDNRFKLVVLYSGPHYLKANETSKLRFKMPKYIGSVKVMVVAVDNNKNGSGDKAIPVNKPVMVLATLPRMLAPGEKVALPVSAFIMEEGIKKAEISVETNDFFVCDSSSKTIIISDLGEYTTSFNLSVAEKIGTGTVKVKVRTNKASADYEINIKVRNPNLPVKYNQNIVLDAGKSQTLTSTLPGMQGTNKVTLEVSSMPPLNLNKRLEYLLRYPYGCIEQTVSSVFPLLYIDQLTSMSEVQKNQQADYLQAGINRLMRFQNSDGGFSYWPGSGYTNEWGTVYALHFITEAAAKGYSIPFGMKDKAVEYLKSATSSWNRSRNVFYYDYQQAYRLYVLALAGNPDLSGMNRMRQKTSLDSRSSWRLAAAYALVGKKDIAESLVEMDKLVVEEYEDMSETYGSRWRDYAMLLETLDTLNKSEEVAKMVKEFSEVLSRDTWLSTKTTAWMLM